MHGLASFLHPIIFVTSLRPPLDPCDKGFWNQFGPNCTTWLVAAESFPTDVRATFQGISAASGKVGSSGLAARGFGV